ncbi:hypothetical protein OESDEN_19592 [Oesophagostomum dentatum]|uniref:Uncharacterized protein n=1 Tax=Oesophagostomum dentatum TaxID=61180 RepID=A0A0B1S722_OESDE|nr:hypothetical protein OESDEN_19592 [Oesophagostomum dentatum]
MRIIMAFMSIALLMIWCTTTASASKLIG